jgi:hypothetical protein
MLRSWVLNHRIVGADEHDGRFALAEHCRIEALAIRLQLVVNLFDAIAHLKFPSGGRHP